MRVIIVSQVPRGLAVHRLIYGAPVVGAVRNEPAPANVGTFTVGVPFTNASAVTMSDIVFEVVILDPPNVLCNADGGPGGVGSFLTAPLTGALADGLLEPGETYDASFELGIVGGFFNFFVNVLGNTTP